MYLPVLQVLRAVAALLVLLFHARLAMAQHPDLQSLRAVFQYGFVGVDIFFVLSGFVVGMSAQAMLQGLSLKNFAYRRMGRIYLGYWPIFACAVLVWHSGTGAVKLNYAQFWPSLLLLEPHLYSNWLIVAWSLTYELYFYALIGLAHYSGRPKTLIAFFCTGLLCLHLYWHQQMGGTYIHGTPWPFVLSPFCLSFFAGYAVLLCYQSHGANFSWCILGLGMLIFGAYLGMNCALCADVPLYRVGSFGLCGVGALILALGLQGLWKSAPAWLAAGAALGDSSYSLYLWHTVLLQIGAYLIGQCLPQARTTMLLFALLLPVLCVLWATVWFRYVEWPLYKKFLSYFATN
ncbi:MAG: hypothetical protein RLZZ502_1139 [Pseudomonadota bacterium]